MKEVLSNENSKKRWKLDPVGSTVRYEMMMMPLYIAKSGDLDRCYRCLTDSQSKDSATQLLTKYKSGALATQ